jgi:hypothetical protein
MDAVTPALKTYKMFVGGHWVDAASNDSFNEYLQTKSVWISTATEVPNPFVLR